MESVREKTRPVAQTGPPPDAIGSQARLYTSRILGCIHIYEWSATGAMFSHFEKRGVTHTGCLLATSDKEMGKNGPVPSGCGVNWAILRCRPRPWSHQSLRPPPCLAQFTLATLTTRICGYTLGLVHTIGVRRDPQSANADPIPQPVTAASGRFPLRQPRLPPRCAASAESAGRLA